MTDERSDRRAKRGGEGSDRRPTGGRRVGKKLAGRQLPSVGTNLTRRMGIEGVNDVIRKNAPHAFCTVGFEALRGLLVAVDISIFFNRLVKSRGDTDWRNGFVDFLTSFKKYGIIPEFVFDGPDMPEEKQATQQERRDTAQKSKDRLADAKAMRPELIRKQAFFETLTEEEIAEITRCIGPIRVKNLAVNFDDIADVTAKFDIAIKKMETQSLSILASYSSEAKDLIEAFGYCYYQADGEAEGLCVSLVLQGVCDAVVTSDTDVMVYGVPYMISTYDHVAAKAVIVVLKDVLEGLGLTFESFRDMCIMLGCDYNSRPRLPGKSGDRTPAVLSPKEGGERQLGTGPAKAYELIREYRCLEAMRDMFVEGDYERMRVERCREIFTPPSIAGLPIPKVRDIDVTYMSTLFKKLGISRSVAGIAKLWEPPEFVVEEEEVYEDE